MKIVINDANILIDIAKLDLLKEFAGLDFELYTTDFVLEEVRPDQNLPITELIELGKLTLIITKDPVDYQGILKLLEDSSGLSFEDCSVWYYSKKMNGILLTGDRKLRKTVEQKGVEVRGILYVLDALLEQRLITFGIAIDKVELLYKFNNRLPKVEILKRIESWKKEKYVE